ncbi:MAG TPA: UvrB/UvrC motif-containing protein [Candidatus Omnitrophota bacterium]|nr:UvrB/UvrC motif-containing protein [Candidatus Omnitrophota bacterium]
MLCDICGKNPATVHLTEIIDEQMTELHLCEECASQKSMQMEQQFGLGDLLAGLVDLKPAKEKEPEPVSLKCPACSLSYSDFKKLGRLGCKDCYVTFKRYLVPLLKKIHGSGLHLGKSPLRAERVLKKKDDLQELRLRLQKAIQQEEFEEAARLRDQIKEAERGEKEP